jgi:L-ascorbate metabolism protein UlaG (beta-lactamase superfamily)
MTVRLPTYQLQMRWLGVAGIEFKIDDQTLLIDPFLTRPPLVNILRGRVNPDRELILKNIPAADQILVTHSHYDHLMDVPVIAKQTGAHVYGSSNVCQLLSIFQLPSQQIHEIHSNEIFNLPYASIRTIRAKHPALPGYLSGSLNTHIKPPLRSRDYRLDVCYSYLVDFKKIKVLVWSSTSNKDAQPADILFSRAVAGQKWNEKMMKVVQPRLVIPTHWDDMFQSLSFPIVPFFAPPALELPPLRKIDLEKFKKEIILAKPGCKILIPEVLKSYNLMDEMEN